MVKKKLKKFKTYNKLNFRGKPVGKEFIFHSKLLAKDKISAKKAIQRINREHNKQFRKEGMGYSVKNTRVKRI